MQPTRESIGGANLPPLDVVLDGAILGVSQVYPSQRAGIWRFLREWMRELDSRSDVRLHLVSRGRAPWNELAVENAFRLDPFLKGLRADWNPRPGPSRAWRSCQSVLARWAFGQPRARMSPTALVGFLRTIQFGLDGALPRIPGVYHSPYHALPTPRQGTRGSLRSITIHDMIPVIFPQWFDDTTPFRKAIGGVGPGDHVFADSRSTRSDILERLEIPADHVHVAYPGISPGFRPRNRESCRAELARLGIGPVRFLLAVGTLEPRKNLPALLQAFARLVAEHPEHADLHLVLTGARGWKNEEFDRELGALGPLRDRVLATGFLADDDLPVLYGACEAFVFPSLYEGFGLPIAEAQACGAAVVCVDNSSQPEVAGEVSALARDATPEALCESIREVLSSPDRLDSMRAGGPDNASRFGWSGCVDAYLDVWRREMQAIDGNRK